MELESEDGSLIKLESDDNNNNNKAVFGRSSGFNTKDDRTISRRHILFTTKTEPTRGSEVVSFEVVGKNPIWVRSNGKEGIRVFSRFERGDVEGDDWFCVCGQNPVWYTVKKRVELGLDDSDDVDVDVDVDVSDIDPVKVFGFLVIGHEFDQYPRRMMPNVKDWDWFLEEPRKNSDDDGGEVKRGIGRKRKKTTGHRDDDDDDWTSDEDEDKDQIAKARKVPGRKYSTRSKDTRKPRKDSRLDQLSTQRRSVEMEDNEEGEDDDIDEEDDETLGGFIVDDNKEVEPEEESDYDNDEEEEEDEDEDDED
ncbi:hypothetical protein ACFE04_003932 [Oxalis oulophora]